MHADQPDLVENEFRNIKLKLKGPNRHSELQAVKALMAMSAQNSMHHPYRLNEIDAKIDNNPDRSGQNLVVNFVENNQSINLMRTTELCRNDSATKRIRATNGNNGKDGNNGGYQNGNNDKEKPIDLSRSESPEPIYGLAITMTEGEFKELAEREGIEDVIGEPLCKLCGGLFSGPLGIALHMCPAMKRQTFRCEICGEDKWKTKANLHSHIKWCKKRLSIKTEQHQSKQVY